MDTTGWPSERWVILGEAIAKARRAKGWDQPELATRSGNSANTISNYERGRASRSRRIPGGYLRVAQALGWPHDAPELILSGESPEVVLSQQSLFDILPEADADADYEGLTRLGPPPWRGSVPANIGRLGARDIELTESGYLAQDVFMRQEKRYRKLKGVSAEKVAQRISDLGGSLTAFDLERLEDGTRLLKMTEAKLIAEALETTVDWLLGSGFSLDVPDEMKRPPNADELEVEAKAVLRRLGELGGQALAAQHAHMQAQQREMQARQEASLALAGLQTVTAHEREMERHYQYLLGRIDSLREAAGEPTVIEMVPVYEGDEKRARQDDLENPPS